MYVSLKERRKTEAVSSSSPTNRVWIEFHCARTIPTRIWSLAVWLINCLLCKCVHSSDSSSLHSLGFCSLRVFSCLIVFHTLSPFWVHVCSLILCLVCLANKLVSLKVVHGPVVVASFSTLQCQMNCAFLVCCFIFTSVSLFENARAQTSPCTLTGHIFHLDRSCEDTFSVCVFVWSCALNKLYYFELLVRLLPFVYKLGFS